jgi:signal transduction histidine kinase
MDEPVPVFSNPDRIEQVLIILLDNAIKHTPTAGTVSLLTTDKGDYTELCVSNTGGGIPADDLPHIFERFYTVDKSHSGGGTGLGLSIANEILKGLNEIVRAESTPGEMRFVLTVHKS